MLSKLCHWPSKGMTMNFDRTSDSIRTQFCFFWEASLLLPAMLLLRLARSAAPLAATAAAGCCQQLNYSRHVQCMQSNTGAISWTFHRPFAGTIEKPSEHLKGRMLLLLVKGLYRAVKGFQQTYMTVSRLWLSEYILKAPRGTFNAEILAMLPAVPWEEHLGG